MKTVAVVGLGNIAIRHRKNIKELFPNVKVIAVSASGRNSDQKISDADKVVLRLSDAMVENLDMAIVASPATLHAEHALELLKAGVPVLIEKPLTASVQDAENVLQAAHSCSTVACVAYCLRYLPIIKKLKNLLQKNSLGSIYNIYCETGQYLPHWRPGKNFKNSVSASKALGGGALLELSHEIDYLHYLFGDLEPKSAILRRSRELDLDVEDQVNILAINRENQVITMHLDFLQKKPYRKLRIIGELGTIECDLISNRLIKNTPDKEIIIYEEENFDRNQMYLEMLKDFNQLILGRKNSTVSLTEGLKTVSFINQVKKIANII